MCGELTLCAILLTLLPLERESKGRQKRGCLRHRLLLGIGAFDTEWWYVRGSKSHTAREALKVPLALSGMSFSPFFVKLVYIVFYPRHCPDPFAQNQLNEFQSLRVSLFGPNESSNACSSDEFIRFIKHTYPL